MLNVVVSAYACFPNHGSEPEVGYRWVREMSSRYQTVTVLTSHWSYERTRNCFPPNVELVPLGQRDGHRHKDTNRILFQLYYFLWTFSCFFYVKRELSRGKKYDYALSLTFGGIHMPSALPLTGVPTGWGPIGGEVCDLRLAYGVSPKLFVRMLAMKIGVIFELLNPIWLISFWGSKRVFVKWSGTRKMLPRSKRIAVMRENGMATPPNRTEAVLRMQRNIMQVRAGHPSMLYAGRLKLHKGVTMLHSISMRLRDRGIEGALDVVGSGELSQLMQETSGAEGSTAFRFCGRLDREVLMKSYSKYNMLLFPSMNDPSPHVVHEALSEGCIVLAYAESGAADIAKCAGMPVVAAVNSREKMIDAFADAIVSICDGSSSVDFAKYEEYLSNWTYSQVIQKNLDVLDFDLAGKVPSEKFEM